MCFKSYSFIFSLNLLTQNAELLRSGDEGALLQAMKKIKEIFNSSPVMGDYYCQGVSLWSGVPPSSELPWSRDADLL